MTVTFRQLNPWEPFHIFVNNAFYGNWAHNQKSAKVSAIYTIATYYGEMERQNRRCLDYRAYHHGIYQFRFHGTSRTCHLGDDPSQLTPCLSPACCLCSILRRSFDLDHASYGAMFGPGIYSTVCSSKADNYVKNNHMHSYQHVMLICAVIPGKKQPAYRAEHNRTSPNCGYDSVEAVPIYRGGAVRYPETVVYTEDAIIPTGIVVYSRQNLTLPW